MRRFILLLVLLLTACTAEQFPTQPTIDAGATMLSATRAYYDRATYPILPFDTPTQAVALPSATVVAPRECYQVVVNSINVRSLPNLNGRIVGGLILNDVITVDNYFPNTEWRAVTARVSPRNSPLTAGWVLFNPLWFNRVTCPTSSIQSIAIVPTPAPTFYSGGGHAYP